MTDNVIPFPQWTAGDDDTLYWECLCECQLFFLREDGAIECGECGRISMSKRWFDPTEGGAA